MIPAISSRNKVPPSSAMGAYKFCTQHRGSVASSDVGEMIISRDGLTQHWICTTCKKNNLRKLAVAFNLPEESLLEP